MTNLSIEVKKKKKNYWKQSLNSSESKNLKKNKIKKSLKYILFLKKYNNNIEYKNIKLLKAFLNKHGKIKSRRKTRIKLEYQRKISKAIRKARFFGLLPFTVDVTY